MPNTRTEGRHTAEHILAEGVNARKRVTLLSGETVVAGQVLGVVTASGKYKVFDQDAADGSENAAGISYANYDATDGDMDIVVNIRDTRAIADAFTWPDDIEAGEKDTALAALDALNIVAN